jgi:hypothetical protein
MSLEFLQGAEFAEPTEVRVQKALTHAQPAGTGGMQLGAINRITRARLQWAVAELAGMGIDEAMVWLRDLAKDSPAAALDRLIEIIKFTSPQQKSMTVENVPTDSTNYGNLTVKQLQGLVFAQPTDDRTVSEQ